MPMYEFHCNKCNDNFEELASATETVSCPKCGSNDTERLMSACRCITGSGGGDDYSASSGGHSSGCGCSGCSGGHCSTCAH
ncbi:MAG: zinc ribbon domain-containing protein [Desulfovibrionaceae bacterium]|nr:zinc ribbon domain-containing protein [Desulfovibrionaceae bacterium]